MASASQPPSPTRSSARMHRHPHRVARTQRGQRLRLDPVAWHEVQLVALRQQGEHERRLHQREALADALAWPASKWEVGVARSGVRTFGGEPIGVEALGVLPQRRISMRYVGTYGDRRIGGDAVPVYDVGLDR